ncbi:MAG: SGNH/GDSL hydrolase family protein, partial [Endomicrobiaceae bacterium]|nr:SGNH/GDSL hydrolase family protein [Endomicrobiaceae bacterium]
ILFDKNYTLYSDNYFRFTKCNYNSDETYVFLGDSFTFGYGLSDNETLPYCFSKLYNFEKNVINCGVSGKGSNSSLIILNNGLFLPFINNENTKIKCFIYVLIYDHVLRNFRYKGSCLDGYLYENHKWYIPTTIGKIKYVLSKSYVFSAFFTHVIDKCLKRYYEDYMIKSLEKMNKIIREKYKSHLVVVFNDDILYFENFGTKLKNTNLDFIFLPDKFISAEEGYRLKDYHPAAKANEEIAEILYNHINGNDKTN